MRNRVSGSPSAQDFAGTLIQPVESRFWVRIRSPERTEGWMVVDYALVARPNAMDFDADPLSCS